MTEDDSSLVAAATFDVHKIRVRSGNKSLEFVGLSFCFESGM
jgi:hypothetical protein